MKWGKGGGRERDEVGERAVDGGGQLELSVQFCVSSADS
jgi:hypothetical protein